MTDFYNDTPNTVISGTSNADSIYNNNAEKVSINAGAGNDTVYNYYVDSDYCIINTGAGNDSYYGYFSDHCTINTGTGNDTINSSTNVGYNVFAYTSGDGNDVIMGLLATDTLQIGGGYGTYSTTKSGSDIIVNVGTGKITLVGAADLDTLNIDGVYGNSLLVTLTEGNDTYSNSVEGATIAALGGSDKVTNKAANVSISGGTGNDSIWNDALINYVTIQAGAGDDSIMCWGNYNSIDAGAGNDYIYRFPNNATVHAGTGNDRISLYSGSSNGDLITYTSGDGNDTIYNIGTKNTLQIGDGSGTYSTQVSGSDIIVNVGTGKISLVGAADLDTVNIDGVYKNSLLVTLTDGNDTYSNTLDGATIQALGGNDTIRNDAISNEDRTDGSESVSIDAGVGNDSIYNDFGHNATINAGAGNDTIYNDEGFNVSINAGAGNDYINNYWNLDVTLNGGAGNDYIINNYGDYASIDGGAGNDTLYVWCSHNVTLKGGDGADLFMLYNRSNSYDDGDHIITDYAEEDTIKLDNPDLAIKSITNDGNNVTFTFGNKELIVKNAADKVITYIDADGVTKTYPATEENTWTISGTTAKYGTSSNTLITVKGVKSLDGISLSGNVVTVSKSSLNAKKITVSDGYTLALAEDVPTPTTKKAAWSLNGTTATYKSSYKTAGYKLASNGKSISYSKATAATTLATVKGVKSTKGLSVSGKVITVSKAALGTSKVSISGTGYTLKLGSDVTAPTTKKAAWSLSGSTATYKSSYKTAGYKLASNGKSISYSKATKPTTLATVKGAKSKSGLSVSGNKITLKNSALSKKVTVSGGYEFDFAKDYSSATITGSGNADTITTRGSKVSVNGGKGDDTIKILGTGTVKGGAGADIFYYKTSGANVIGDYAEEDKISIESGAASVTTSGDNVVLTVGNGKITAKGAKSKVIAYSDASGDHTYPKDNDVVIDGKKITLTEDYLRKNFNVADYGEALQTIDASAVQQDININGNARKNKIIGSTENDSIYGDDAADTIYGGDGVDTLNGGKGNDILYGEGGNDSLWGNKGDDTLYGGDGADIFVYKKGDGNDAIADFESIDKIMIFNAKVGSYNADTSTGNVTFKVGDGQIVIKNGVDKFITLVDSAENELAKYPK